MPNTYLALAKAIEPDIIRWRRQFHANPEVAFQEYETAAYVMKTLRGFGYSPRIVGETGVVAELEGRGPGKTLGLRADMDALPGTETTNLPFASCKPGVIHSCGHDAHTAILLGAAKILAEKKDSFSGKIKFLFQPAEENLGGAKLFAAAGELDGLDAFAALHVSTELETGTISSRKGPSTAASDTFTITVTGRAAHGAYPHMGVDAVVVAAHIITALQSFVARSVSPLDSTVITVGKLTAGDTFNVIAEQAVLEGTLRTLKPETRELALMRIRSIAENAAAMFGATVVFEVFEGVPVLICDSAWVDRLNAVATQIIPPENVLETPETSMGGEDFSVMLRKAPGVFWWLGAREKGTVPTLPHSGSFQLDEAAFCFGTAIMCALAVDALNDKAL